MAHLPQTNALNGVPALLAVAMVLLLGACGGDDGGLSTPTVASDGVYLSLGDSVAAGSGASDAGSTSFPAIVAREAGFELVNLAAANTKIGDVFSSQLPQIE